jgi:NAD-dependent dihydropyrimidine dehydrogenase PreA subunit
MNDRYLELKQILEDQTAFKVICGAGNEDAAHVKKLAFIYTLAGCKLIDISANVEVTKAAMGGIDLAFEMANEFGVTLTSRPFIMVSVGMPGDHHVRKSYINPYTCVGCNLCVPVCPTNAIPKDFVSELDIFKDLNGSFDMFDQLKEIVIKDLCIGCGKCSNICPKDDIISYRHNKRELLELLPKCMEAGAELFELHAAVGEDNITIEEWELINKINPDNYNSMCLDRLNLGNSKLENRISEAKRISGNKIIIQADGYPMSGGENDYNTTLQAISCADVINKKFNMLVNKKKLKLTPGKAQVTSKKSYKPINDLTVIPIILSGGTNEFSKELSDMVGVRINGVAIGTYARDIVEEHIQVENFYENKKVIREAYLIAKNLVTKNIK